MLGMSTQTQCVRAAVTPSTTLFTSSSTSTTPRRRLQQRSCQFYRRDNSLNSFTLLSSTEGSYCRGDSDFVNLFRVINSRPTTYQEGNANKLVVSPRCVLPLTEENVEKVLEEFRPGLMADGGNVALHEIDGLVVLKHQGACGSCPSSAMTLKMGIETRLRDKIPGILAVEQILDAETGLDLKEEC